MKKLYTLISVIVLFSGASKAQLTLTRSANEPVAGDIVLKQGMDTTTAMPITTTGSNVVWNYSSLVTTTLLPQSIYTSTSSVSSATAYPGCTLVEDQGGGNYYYWKSTPTPQNFELMALDLSTVNITFTNTGIAAQFPITMGYSLSDPIAGSIIVGSFSGTFTGTNTVMANGTGTLQLPNGLNFSNCLLVQSTQFIDANMTVAQGTLLNTSYDYYNGSFKFPVLSVMYSHLTVPNFSIDQTQVTININKAIYAGINELSLDNTYAIYPNPASGNFHVILKNPKSEPISIEISDQLGKVIKKQFFGNSDVNASIDISAINPGVYFVKTSQGERSATKKLIIQ